MGQLGKSSCRRRVLVCCIWDGKLMEHGINAFHSSSKEWCLLFFFFRSTGALEMIYNRCFTFLNLFLIYWTCLAEIIKQSCGCFISSNTSG